MGLVDGIDLFTREFAWDGDRYVRLSIACGTTGEGGINAGTWYVCRAGQLVEASERSSPPVPSTAFARPPPRPLTGRANRPALPPPRGGPTPTCRATRSCATAA